MKEPRPRAPQTTRSPSGRHATTELPKRPAADDFLRIEEDTIGPAGTVLRGMMAGEVIRGLRACGTGILEAGRGPAQ